MSVRSAIAFLLATFATVAAPPGGGQAGGEWITVEAADREVRAWVVHPETDGPAPTIIVIHANRGLNDWTRSVADRLAAEGYIAAAPDLLSGTGPNGGGTDAFADSDAAREGIYALTDRQVLDGLDAVADWLVNHPDSNGEVSVSGFCWGGSRTFQYATHHPGLTAAYVFYGTAPDDPAALARIGAEVHGFYGGEDDRVTSTVEPTAAAMEAAGKTYDPVIYDGAGHGFLSDGESADGSEADRQAAEQAWQRWRELLARHRAP